MKRFLSRLRRSSSSLFELAGFIVLTVAAWQVSETLGLAVVGVSLLLIGYASGGNE